MAALYAPVAGAADSDSMEATTSHAARQDAEKAIPWGELSHQDQRLVRYVVNGASLYRRMPTRVVDCDPDMFSLLCQRPEVVVNLWNVLGVSNLELERISDNQFRATDKLGTSGVMRVLNSCYEPGAQNRLLLFVDGSYHSPPIPGPVEAKCVLLLRTGSTIETDGRPYVAGRLDSFVMFERKATELVARTLQSVIGTTADHNFTETMKFASVLSRSAESDPDRVAALTPKLDRVSLEGRDELIRQSHATARRYNVDDVAAR
ncbi:hypothetical protein [Pirellulimonas nuda]|nr:hypothetical protein [Pirellulimonas nuda]